MRHESIDHIHPDIRERREAATKNLANAAIQLTSVMTAYDTEIAFGSLSEETKDQANEAGHAYNRAIAQMLDAQAGLYNL